jgi:hypothetical protein
MEGWLGPKPAPEPRLHHQETGELNLNHAIGARRSIPLPLLREYHIILRSMGTIFQPPCREEDEPFIRNAIGRGKFIHQPIVCRPAHPLRLVRSLVVGRITAES